jgi:alanyl-tRNA synthetase
MQTELKWTASKVRSTFIDFFKNKAHTVVPSSSVVPLQDPTLLFVNSGMAQFKPLFLGTADPSTDFGKMTRAVDSQICIRAGGKHNDLDDVGYDTYHHTLFEMLGTWSFGDYYKEDAICWAWEILTKVYEVPAERLYVTYFEGSEKMGLPADEETRGLWRRFVPEERILKGNAKDNFWEMGESGPCGPCTEIHYDYLGGRDAAPLVNKDDPTVIEIWNLVFMQFNRASKGADLTRLPKCHVDTGMGFERLCSLLQGVRSNYDVDVWIPIFSKIQSVCKVEKSYAELVKLPEATDKNHPVGLQVIAYRVIADHVRTLTAALADGAAPDNQGRGFVLRRIIRRAIRYGVQFFNADFGFFSQLVPAVGEAIGDHFTYFTEERTQKRVIALISDEEASFAKTWKTGLKHFEKAVDSSKKAKSKEIDPEDTFVLHDRYGFPVDLTKLLAEREGLSVDSDNACRPAAAAPRR